MCIIFILFILSCLFLFFIKFYSVCFCMGAEVKEKDGLGLDVGVSETHFEVFSVISHLNVVSIVWIFVIPIKLWESNQRLHRRGLQISGLLNNHSSIETLLSYWQIHIHMVQYPKFHSLLTNQNWSRLGFIANDSFMCESSLGKDVNKAIGLDV